MTRADERISVLEGKIDGLEKGIEEVRSKVKAEIAEMATQFNGRLDGLEARLNAKLEALLRQLTLDKGKGLADGSGSGSIRAAATPTVLVIPPENVGCYGRTPTTPTPAVNPPENRGCYGRTPTAPTPAKLELPYFSGENPSTWISRAEQYFCIDNTPEEMKLEFALIAMEGTALQWLQWMLTRFPAMGWRKFTIELLRRYGEDPRTNPYEALVATTQTGTVDEYVDQFIARLLSVTNLDDSVALGMFLNGLKEEIRWKIRSKDLEDILTTMHLAREIERELDPSGNTTRNNQSHNRPSSLHNGFPSRGGRVPSSSNQPRTGIGDTNPSASVSCPPCDTGQPAMAEPKAPNAPMRPRRASYMTHSEYDDLRARGLCYRCKESYHPTHVCSKKSFGVMLVDENENVEAMGEDVSGEKQGMPP
ncbi:hypothetical protein ACS0TY_007492 [Phlomoides rotata]